MIDPFNVAIIKWIDKGHLKSPETNFYTFLQPS